MDSLVGVGYRAIASGASEDMPPFPTSTALPSLSLPCYDRIWDFTGPKMVSLLKKYGGELFSKADPEWYKKVSDQSEAVVQFLKDKGIVVHRPREHTEDENKNQPKN